MNIKTNAISKAPLTKHLTIDSDKRVFVVGDLDGDYSRLKAQLDKVNFNPDEDTLISLGDIIDRGPDSSSRLPFAPSGPAINSPSAEAWRPMKPTVGMPRACAQ